MRRPVFPPRLHPPRLHRLGRTAALMVALAIGLPSSLAEDSLTGVLAIVNDTSLPIEDAQRQFDYYAPLYDEFDQGDALDALRRVLACSAVRRFLILSDCRRLGLEMDDAEKTALRRETDAELQRLLHAQMHSSLSDETASGLTLSAAEVCLARNGLTAETLFDRALEDTLIERHLEFVTGGIQVDEDALYAAFEARAAAQQAAYAQNPALLEHDVLMDEIICFIPDGTRRVMHMLILADEDEQRLLEVCLTQCAQADEDSRDALNEQLALLAAPLLERAEPLAERLKNGESMAALKTLYEGDSRILFSPLTGGEYSYVAQTGSLWEDALRSAAQSLEKSGDVSEPIITALGVHLIQLVDVPSPGPVDYLSVRSRLEEELTGQARQAAYERHICALFDAADILWYDDNLAYPDEVD